MIIFGHKLVLESDNCQRYASATSSVWATEPHADLPIKMGTTGAAAKAPSTVYKVFQKAVENHGENAALKFKDTSGVSIFSC